MLDLQQTLGNQDIQRMVKTGIVQTKLKISYPNDPYEREADKVAELIVSESTKPLNVSVQQERTTSSILHRQEQTNPDIKQNPPKTEKSTKDKLQEAGKKTGEALLETDFGKSLKKEAGKLGKKFTSSLEGKIIAGAAAVGVVSALAIKNAELPLQIPAIPLDIISPGLKVKITYEGPVRKPTNAFILFSGTFGSKPSQNKTKKPKMTKSEKYRAETAKMAAEQEQFRESLKSPEQKQAEEDAFWNLFLMNLPPHLIPGGNSEGNVTSPDSPTPSLLKMRPKLKVSQPDDPYEREADRVADQIVRMSDSFSYSDVSNLKPQNDIYKKENPIKINRKSVSVNDNLDASDEISNQINSVVGGKSLDSNTKSFMESRFNHDFSSVRIHDNSKSWQLAGSVNARAFTVDDNIFMGQNESVSDKRLMAHELTHVVQRNMLNKSKSNTYNSNVIQRQAKPNANKEKQVLLIKDLVIRKGETIKSLYSRGLAKHFGIKLSLARQLLEKYMSRGSKLSVTSKLKAGKKIDLTMAQSVYDEITKNASKRKDAKSPTNLKDFDTKDKEPKDQDTKDKEPKDQDIPKDILEWFGGKSKLEKYNQEELKHVIQKLKKLTLDERRLYRQIATHLTHDLKLLAKSIDAFIEMKNKYKEALEKQAKKEKGKPTLEEKIQASRKDVDYDAIKKLPQNRRLTKMRQLTAEQRNIRLRHMVENPGETAKGMISGLNPVEVGKAVTDDIKEAANGNKSALARWAAGTGATGKIAGWIGAIAGIAYVALLFVPGVNVAVLATTAIAAGVTAITLATVEQELRVHAAAGAKTEKEMHHNIDKAAEAQTTAIVGAVLMGLGPVLGLLGKIRLPGRVQNVGQALRQARQAMGQKTGATAVLESVRAKVLKIIKGEKAGLPEALAKEMVRFKKNSKRIETMSSDQFIEALAKGDKALQEMTGMSVERATQIKMLNQTPMGKGLATKVHREFIRAFKDAPGEVLARVDRVIHTMDDVINKIEGATTTKELYGAIDDSLKKFDTKALTEQATAERLAALKKRYKEELLKESSSKPEPKPSESAPNGMSKELQTIRNSLKDPRAIEQFDKRWSGGREIDFRNNKLKKDLENQKKAAQDKGETFDMEKSLIESWKKKHPSPKTPSGEALHEVPELIVKAEALLDDLQKYKSSHPEIKGVQKWINTMKQHQSNLKSMLKGDSSATVSKVKGERANIDSLQSELQATITRKGVVSVQEEFAIRPNEKLLEVDVVLDEGKTWVDVKKVEPFGTESSTWKGKPGKKGMKAQATDLLEAAKNNPVDGTTPTIVYEFPLGVGESVARALLKLGKGKIKIEGPIIPDKHLLVPMIPPPPRSDPKKGETT